MLVNGSKANLTIESLEMKNSLMYSLLFGINNKENIEAEIERTKNDIELIKVFILLNKNISLVLSLIRQSEDTSVAEHALVKEFNITIEQAKFYLELELNIVNKLEFDVIKRNMESYIVWLSSLLA